MMKKTYILTHDLGTSGNKTALFDTHLNCVAKTSMEYPIYYPKPGWAEQEAEDFWKAVVDNTNSLLNDNTINSDEIKALSFTCQMNSTIAIDDNGTPLMRAISWLDTRAASITRTFTKGFPKVSGYPLFKILTFLRIAGGGPGHNGKDPISHILWLKLKEPEIYDQAYKFLSVKDFVINRCTEKAITSKDLAHTSWMMDSRPGQFIWADKLLNKYKIASEKLPEIKDFHEEAGKLTLKAAKELNLTPDTPVYVGSGDLTSSAIGSGALKINQKIMCLGTAAWVGAHVVERKLNLKTYIGPISSFKDRYLLISKQETGAACLDWIKNQMFKDKIKQLKSHSHAIYEYFDELATNLEAGSKKLIFTPWMFGERSPINDPDVRGGFYNLSLDHTREDMLKAVYEGVGFNLNWSLRFIEKMIPPSEEINLIGGGANSDAWCQIISDITGKRINQMNESGLCGAMGATVSAMIGMGHLSSYKEAIPFIKINQTFVPNKENKTIYRQLFEEYTQIYERNKPMFLNLNP